MKLIDPEIINEQTFENPESFLSMIKEINDFRMLGKNPLEKDLPIVIDMAHSLLDSLDKEEARTKG